MRAWEVTAKAYDRHDGSVLGRERSEIIDADNELFSECETIQDVHETYERFWNGFGGSESVFVVKVVPL